MNAPHFIFTNESITVIWEGKSHAISKDHANFRVLRQAIIDENWEVVVGSLTVAKSIESWAKGKFTFKGGDFYYMGEMIDTRLNQRIRDMASQNEDPQSLFAFWERLQKNPSMRSVAQLYSFLQNEGIALTPDGYILAYKAVTRDYKDVHSRQFINTPGTTNEMPRNKISDDPRVACHEGFHVGAIIYANSFGPSDRRIVICKVDPADVVCVPYDSSHHKMRVSKYVVLGNHNGESLPSTTFEEDVEQTSSDSESEMEDDSSSENSDGDFCDDCGVPGGDEHDVDCINNADGNPDPNEVVKVTLTSTKCDECGSYIPDSETSPGNAHHAGSCSLYACKPVPKTEPTEKAAATMRVWAKVEEKAEKKPTVPKFTAHQFNRMDMADLMGQSLEDLRKYAGHALSIIGASKIPGGKTALVSRIMEVREK